MQGPVVWCLLSIPPNSSRERYYRKIRQFVSSCAKGAEHDSHPEQQLIRRQPISNQRRSNLCKPSPIEPPETMATHPVITKSCLTFN
jgi:hypothetical protein